MTWPGGWFTCVGTSSGAHLQVLTPQRLSEAFLGGQAASSACPGTLGSSALGPSPSVDPRPRGRWPPGSFSLPMTLQEAWGHSSGERPLS